MSEHRRIGKVFSHGSITAPIYVLGEAAGEEEIKLHVGQKGRRVDGVEDYVPCPTPFVGPAGRLLRRIFKWATLIEGDYIISNACSFWPVEEFKDKGRTPTEKEVLEEKPRVLDEIRKIDPKLIITIGKVPLWQLILSDEFPTLRGVRMQDYIGKLQSIHTDEDGTNVIPVLPLYHTSYLLRSAAAGAQGPGSPKRQVAEAIQANRELIEDAIGRPIMI